MEEQNQALPQKYSSRLIETESSLMMSKYEQGILSHQVKTDAATIIFAAFPKVEKEFVKLLISLAAEDGFSDAKFLDAVKYVVKNFKYEHPKISDFLQFDKVDKLLTHNDMCMLADKFGVGAWSEHEKVLINNKIYWRKLG